MHAGPGDQEWQKPCSRHPHGRRGKPVWHHALTTMYSRELAHLPCMHPETARVTARTHGDLESRLVISIPAWPPICCMSRTADAERFGFCRLPDRCKMPRTTNAGKEFAESMPCGVRTGSLRIGSPPPSHAAACDVKRVQSSVMTMSPWTVDMFHHIICGKNDGWTILNGYLRTFL